VAGSVAWITIAPVKGLALTSLEEAVLERAGVAGDRAYHLLDVAGRLVNGKRLGRLMAVRAEATDGALVLRLPDGTEVGGEVELGDDVTTDFYGRPVRGQVVRGPWGEALSQLAGERVRLVRVEAEGDGVDRGVEAAATLLGTASLDAFAAAAGLAEQPDARRFRMLLGVDGVEAHEEDGWIGCRVRAGEAVVVPRGNVGRCAVTSYHPDTCERDLDTLHVLRDYRARVLTTEPLPFGVWGEVVEPGRVALGDPVLVE
jgi:uncharacterized protein YcbX